MYIFIEIIKFFWWRIGLILLGFYFIVLPMYRIVTWTPVFP